MDYESIDDYRSHIKERLAKIETILERELPEIKEQLKVANGRTRSLENWRNYMLGGMGLITFLLTTLKYENTMLMKMIADELLSDKTGEEIIDEINKAVDIPIISEKTEKAILEALWKVIKGVLLKKIGV